MNVFERALMYAYDSTGRKIPPAVNWHHMHLNGQPQDFWDRLAAAESAVDMHSAHKIRDPWGNDDAPPARPIGGIALSIDVDAVAEAFRFALELEAA